MFIYHLLFVIPCAAVLRPWTDGVHGAGVGRGGGGGGEVMGD